MVDFNTFKYCSTYDDFSVSKNYKWSSQIKISFIIPIRKTVDEVCQSLDSIFGLSSSPDNIEVLLRFDNDDIESYNDFIQRNCFNEYNVKAYIGDRTGYRHMYYMHNQLYFSSVGYFVIPWSDNAMMHSKNWDIPVYENIGKFVVLCPEVYARHRNQGFVLDHISRQCQFLSRPLLEVIGYYSPVELSDAYLDRISYFCGIRKKIDIITSIGEMTTARTFGESDNPWISFFSDSEQNILKKDCEKIINYMESYNISYQKYPFIDIRCYDNFLDSSAGSPHALRTFPVVEILGGPLSSYSYKVYFINKKTNDVLHYGEIGHFSWTSFITNKYYDFLVRVVDENGNTIHEYSLDLKGKKVLIHINSASRDRIEECIQYINSFCDKHNCVALCSSMLIDYRDDHYESIKFVYRDDLSMEYSSINYKDSDDLFENQPIFIKYVIEVDDIDISLIKERCCDVLGL